MIPSLIQSDAFLEELGLDRLSPEEREKSLELIDARFTDVILNTVLAYLSPEQFEAFKAAMKSENPEEEIAGITAGVPGLSGILEERIQEEYRLLKAAMAN